MLQGWTSAGVVRKIRGMLEGEYRRRHGVKRKVKVGHGGTLDPLATGVLVIGVGDGCKELTGYLKGGGKEYYAVSSTTILILWRTCSR
jgi:tRNA pseudouridine55 synthase